MKRLLSWLGVVVAAAWGLIAFMANQSVDDTRKNIASYADDPIIRSLPDWVYGVASSTWSLAINFFILGCVATILFANWRSGRGSLTPVEKLSSEVSLAAYSLDNMSNIASNPATLANLDVVMNDLRNKGFATPPLSLEPFFKDKLSYYLHSIAARLEKGDLASAKGVAQTLVNQWDRQ